MDAMKNLVHGVALSVWGALGLAFTLKVVFGLHLAMGPLLSAGAWWLWFAGFAALTTWGVRQFANPVAAGLLHAGAFLALEAIPRVFPLTLLRLGLDLLRG